MERKDTFVIDIQPNGNAQIVRGGLAEKIYRALLSSLNLTSGSVISLSNNDIIAKACFVGLSLENLEDALKEGNVDELLIDTLNANIARARAAVKDGGPIADIADRFLAENGIQRIEKSKLNDAIFSIRRSEEQLNNLRGQRKA